MNLIDYEFNCPFCGKSYMTFIEKDKLQAILSRSDLIHNILPGYILEKICLLERFISKICSKCQVDTFRDPDAPVDPDEKIEIFDVEINAPNKDIEHVKTKIETMIENASRNN